MHRIRRRKGEGERRMDDERDARVCVAWPKVRIRCARHLQLGKSSPHRTQHPPCVSVPRTLLSSARPMAISGFVMVISRLTKVTRQRRKRWVWHEISGHGRSNFFSGLLSGFLKRTTRKSPSRETTAYIISRNDLRLCIISDLSLNTKRCNFKL